MSLESPASARKPFMKLISKLVIVSTASAGLAGSATYHKAMQSCIVGITGTNASVTVRGWGASTACQVAVKEGQAWAYAREEVPTEPVLCEVQQHHRRYIVRDTGGLMLVGRGLCYTLMHDDSL